MKNIIRTLFIILFVILEIYVLTNSNLLISDFNMSLNNCIYNVLPTMFSSILLSQILIELEIEKYIPKFIKNIISSVFNISDKESIIFLLSIISGYPNNAKMLKDNDNLNKIILFTNFVNPVYLIGTIGIVYLKNINLAITILITHYLTNLIIGLIVRNKYTKNNIMITNKKEKTLFEIYLSSLKNTTISICNIFSNILFFSILLSLLKNILPFNNIINSLIYGLLEFSNGIYEVSFLNIDNFYKGLFILIMINFSSFSIHMQQMSINKKIKYTNFLFYKIISVFIGIIIFIILYILI